MESTDRENTARPSGSEAYFSGICTERCGGLCCDPWWGIISFSVVKEGGLSNLSSFRAELVKSIKARSKRIVDNYVMDEIPPRPLFSAPERYNVRITDFRVNNRTIALGLLAMFAFRCNFLSGDKVCLVHPSAGGFARDIRPPHCGFMGSLNVSPGGKGYCRIIHAAEGGDGGAREAAVAEAIRVEKGASRTNYDSGFESAEDAADSVIGRLKELCAERAPGLVAQPAHSARAPGRNDPCPCGSGRKFKKCHGK